MAEYLLRHRVRDEEGWDISSAGVCAIDGMPASYAARQALGEMGIDMTQHASQFLRKNLADEADVIVVMTNSHMASVCGMYPEARKKVFLLGSFINPDNKESVKEIADPIGLTSIVYKRVRDEIEEALPGLIDFVKKSKEQGK